MKITIISFLLLFFFSTPFLSAQDSESYKLYKMESIYLKGNKYIKNDVEYSAGFLGQNLAKEMEVSQFAMLEWGKFKTARNWSLISSFTGLGLVIAASQTQDPNLQDSLLIGGLAASIISIPISISAGNKLQKAVWTRNRDILQY